MDVHLYALSTCPYCRMTKKFLDEHEVAYELTEVDLLEGDVKDDQRRRRALPPPRSSASREARRSRCSWSATRSSSASTRAA